MEGYHFNQRGGSLLEVSLHQACGTCLQTRRQESDTASRPWTRMRAVAE